MGEYQRKYIDHSNETALVTLRIADLSGDITGELTGLTSLAIALDGVTLLNPILNRIVAVSTAIANGLPADKNAQKEVAWMVHYRDTVTGRNFVFQIPGADMSLTQANSDLMDITTNPSPGLSLVGQLESQIVSIEGNPIEVTYIELKR